MRSDRPTVSVIIPCRNEDPYRIAAAILSARWAKPDEVLLVDDGSVSGPPYKERFLLRQGWSAERAAARGEPVTAFRQISQPPLGIGAALNHGIREARGDYICRLDVGDVYYPDKIRVQLDAMLEHGAEASFHRHASDANTGYDLDRLDTDNQFCGVSIMVKRELMLAFPFDESLTYCQDWDFACRIQYAGPGWLDVPEVLGDFRELPGGHTDRARTDPARKRERDRCRASVLKRWRGAR